MCSFQYYLTCNVGVPHLTPSYNRSHTPGHILKRGKPKLSHPARELCVRDWGETCVLVYWSHVTSDRLYTTALVEISFSSLSRVLASQVGRPGFQSPGGRKRFISPFPVSTLVAKRWDAPPHIPEAGVMGGMELTRGLPLWWLQMGPGN